MIYVKTALKGEGKTKWLLNKAYESIHSGNYESVSYLGTNVEYKTFCEKYFSLYNEVPMIDFYTTDNTDRTCILVDDLFSQNIEKINKLISSSKDSFVTITGTHCNLDDVTQVPDNENVQLSIFD